MEETEHRQIARDSLFVLVDLRLDGQDFDHRIKMRNLSARGLMAEGPVRVTRGMTVWINLRNIGWTDGTVAWVQDNRFGVAFREEIDPVAARGSSQATSETLDAFAGSRPFSAPQPPAKAPVRKI